jgi:hypothetical protein
VDPRLGRSAERAGLQVQVAVERDRLIRDGVTGGAQKRAEGPRLIYGGGADDDVVIDC